MHAGDLSDGPLADILRTLGTADATGGLHVQRRDAPAGSDEGVLFLREGRLYAATSPGPRPLLGVRLVSAGAVTREALEEALESQAGELAGWRLGELLVHLGYVDADIVAEFVVEQILDTVAELSAWPAGGWRFRRGEKTREADGLALEIEDVLVRVAERRSTWRDLQAQAGGAHAVPTRISYDRQLAAEQIPLARTLLTEIDGRRTLADLAIRCGLTTYEAGYVLALLIDSGTVALAETVEPDGDDGTDETDDGDAPVTLALTTDPGDGPEVDLATQLALLARQAEEARFAAESRVHAELAARRGVGEADDGVSDEAAAQGWGRRASDRVSAGVPAVGPVDAYGRPLTRRADEEPLGLEPVGFVPPTPAPTGYESGRSAQLTGPAAAQPDPAPDDAVWVDATRPADDAPTTTTADWADLAAALPPPPPEPPAGYGAPAAATAFEPAPGVDPVDAFDPAAAFIPPPPLAPPPPPPATPPTPGGSRHSRGFGDPDSFDPTVPPEDDRAAIRAALAEVAASPYTAPLPQAPEEPAYAASTPPASAPEVDFTPSGGSDRADTAALMRELSFLGLDSGPTPPPAPRSAPPRAPAAGVPVKAKRKSIFSR